MQPDGEVRALACRQQFESVLEDSSDAWQIYGAEVGEAFPEQILKWHVEYGENRNAQERLPVQRPSPSGACDVSAQFVTCIGTASDDDGRAVECCFVTQERTLIKAVARRFVCHQAWSLVVGLRANVSRNDLLRIAQSNAGAEIVSTATIIATTDISGARIKWSRAVVQLAMNCVSPLQAHFKPDSLVHAGAIAWKSQVPRAASSR